MSKFKSGDICWWSGNYPTIVKLIERCKMFDNSWVTDKSTHTSLSKNYLTLFLEMDKSKFGIKINSHNELIAINPMLMGTQWSYPVFMALNNYGTICNEGFFDYIISYDDFKKYVLDEQILPKKEPKEWWKSIKRGDVLIATSNSSTYAITKDKEYEVIKDWNAGVGFMYINNNGEKSYCSQDNALDGFFKRKEAQKPEPKNICVATPTQEDFNELLEDIGNPKKLTRGDYNKDISICIKHDDFSFIGAIATVGYSPDRYSYITMSEWRANYKKKKTYSSMKEWALDNNYEVVKGSSSCDDCPLYSLYKEKGFEYCIGLTNGEYTSTKCGLATKGEQLVKKEITIKTDGSNKTIADKSEQYVKIESKKQWEAIHSFYGFEMKQSWEKIGKLYPKLQRECHVYFNKNESDDDYWRSAMAVDNNFITFEQWAKDNNVLNVRWEIGPQLKELIKEHGNAWASVFTNTKMNLIYAHSHNPIRQYTFEQPDWKRPKKDIIDYFPKKKKSKHIELKELKNRIINL